MNKKREYVKRKYKQAPSEVPLIHIKLPTLPLSMDWRTLKLFNLDRPYPRWFIATARRELSVFHSCDGQHWGCMGLVNDGVHWASCPQPKAPKGTWKKARFLRKICK